MMPYMFSAIQSGTDAPSCCLQKFTAFDLSEFVAGKSKTWTFWNCDPSEFPWSYAKDEYAYVLAGQFYVTYDGRQSRACTGYFCLLFCQLSMNRCSCDQS